MNEKNGIIVTRNHSEASIIRMQHHLVVKIKKETGHIAALTWSVVITDPAYLNITKKYV